MLITDFRKDGIKYLELHGRVDSSEANFADDLLHLVVGEKKIIIDCTGLNFINSMGLRAFISTVKEVAHINGEVLISNLAPAIVEIFRIAGFDKIFKIFDNADDAKNHFLNN
jgi:anti-sigma B factor antagonist